MVSFCSLAFLRIPLISYRELGSVSVFFDFSVKRFSCSDLTLTIYSFSKIFSKFLSNSQYKFRTLSIFAPFWCLISKKNVRSLLYFESVRFICFEWFVNIAVFRRYVGETYSIFTKMYKNIVFSSTLRKYLTHLTLT